MKKIIKILLVSCIFVFVITCCTAFGTVSKYPVIDENDNILHIEMKTEYNVNSGYTTKIIPEKIQDEQGLDNFVANNDLNGIFCKDGSAYYLNQAYRTNKWDLSDTYTELSPNVYYKENGIKYGIHVIEEVTPGDYYPEPPTGTEMTYSYRVELIKLAPPKDVVFTGKNELVVYVGDKLKSADGIKVDDNGEDLTSMLRSVNVDTSKPGKKTYYWAVTGRSGKKVEFTRTIVIKEKTQTNQTKKDPANTFEKAKKVKVTVGVKGKGKVTTKTTTLSKSVKGKTKKGSKYIKVDVTKNGKVTLKATGKKFRYWQKKVSGKYKKYSKKKTIEIKANANVAYRAIFG